MILGEGRFVGGKGGGGGMAGLGCFAGSTVYTMEVKDGNGFHCV